MVEDVFGIVGTTLAGAFRVEEVIAEGGYGVVYRAEHVAFRAPVALKCLKVPGTISPAKSELFVESFREEAEILFHLSAQIPEVVRPLHADAITLVDGTFVPYLAMEWIDGQPLDSIIIIREEDGLPPLHARKVVKMLTPIAHALSQAHHFTIPGGAVVSVTHCDLKPENILITEPDNAVRAKILDFGIAKARDAIRQEVGRITESDDSRPFTPGYGAPEQWVPKRYGQTGPWTDVWGLAVTMVECLSGQPPIDGDMQAMMGTALDVTRRPTPRSEGASVDDAVERVFERALAVDPRDRYTTIEAFWSDLERAVGAPLSFEEARERRARPAYPEFDSNAPPPGSQPDEELEGLDLAEAVPGGSAPQLEHAPTSRGRPAPRSARRPTGSDPGPIEETGSLAGMAVDSVPPAAGLDLDLDLGGAPHSQPEVVRSGIRVAPRSRPPAAPSAAFRAPPRVSEPEPSLLSRLKTPLILVALGLGLAALELALVRIAGIALPLGPFRLRWISAALAALGLIVAFWNLVGERE